MHNHIYLHISSPYFPRPDITPPVIQCPENITTETEPNEVYANVTWNPPHVKGTNSLFLFTLTDDFEEFSCRILFKLKNY